MTEAMVHILISGINHVFSVCLTIHINILQKFSDTLDKVIQESYCNARRQNELSSPINEQLLSEALDNESTPNTSVSISSKLNDSEIPSKFIPE